MSDVEFQASLKSHHAQGSRLSPGTPTGFERPKITLDYAGRNLRNPCP